MMFYEMAPLAECGLYRSRTLDEGIRIEVYAPNLDVAFAMARARWPYASAWAWVRARREGEVNNEG